LGEKVLVAGVNSAKHRVKTFGGQENPCGAIKTLIRSDRFKTKRPSRIYALEALLRLYSA
jgi:hypothetical protein